MLTEKSTLNLFLSGHAVLDAVCENPFCSASVSLGFVQKNIRVQSASLTTWQNPGAQFCVL